MSEIRANTISDAAGTGPIDLYKQSAAKAWVNFNGTGTVAVRDGMNVSSLIDNGTGIYRVVHTAAFASSNYAVVTGASRYDGIGAVAQELTPRALLATQYDVHAEYNNGSYIDFENCFASLHGDLA